MVRKIVFLLGLLILLIFALPALAGGWVVITVEELPVEIKAGEPVELNFMIRQHGETPTHAAKPFLEAYDTASGTRIRVEAEKLLEIGRYTARITFPVSGQWTWSINADPFPQTAHLAPISVLQGAKMHPVENQPAAIQPLDELIDNPAAHSLRWGGVLLFAASGILFILDRRRSILARSVASD